MLASVVRIPLHCVSNPQNLTSALRPQHQTWKDGYATFRMLAPEQPRMLSTGPWPWKAMWNHKAGSMPLSENPTKSTVIATRRFSAGFSLSHGFYRKLAKCHMETMEKSRRFTFSQCVCYTKLLLFHNINPRYTLRWKRCSTTCRSLAMERAATLHSRHSLKVVNHIPHKPVYTNHMSCIIHYINLVPYIICHISYVIHHKSYILCHLYIIYLVSTAVPPVYLL